MNKLKYFFWGVIIFSCTDSGEKYEQFVTPSGIEVSYIIKGEGLKPEVGKVLLFHTKYLTEDGKVLLESIPDKPLVMGYGEETVEEAGYVKEVIDHMHVGDSIHFEIPARNLYEVSFATKVPDSIGPRSMITFYMKLQDQMDRNAYMEMIAQKNFEANREYFEKEKAELRKFIIENTIPVDSTESGLYYRIVSEGQGSDVEYGDQVVVSYSGKLMRGDEFDNGEISFTLGKEEVIKGWEDGILMLNEGTEAVFYIPSYLGYGSRGAKNIPPFSSLIFEVKVLEVSKISS